jgi:hypothetical protein
MLALPLVDLPAERAAKLHEPAKLERVAVVIVAAQKLAPGD